MNGPRIVLFQDRPAAGRILAQHLTAYASRADVIVLGLPRGGVPVAFEVTQALRAPLDVLLVRKLGVPGHEELAMGAIASGGVRVLNNDIIADADISDSVLEEVIVRETAELTRREVRYRGERPPPALAGAAVIVVDDGLATGATMLAAVTAVHRRNPARIVVAVPVAAPATCAALRGAADEVICPITVEPFRAVGAWYRDFSPTTDEEVRDLLLRARDFGQTSATTPPSQV